MTDTNFFNLRDAQLTQIDQLAVRSLVVFFIPFPFPTPFTIFLLLLVR